MEHRPADPLGRAIAISAGEAMEVKLVTLATIMIGLAAIAAAQDFAVVPTPNPSATHNELRDVTGSADHDVWIVGNARLAGFDRHFIQHWDGQAWTAIASPYISDQHHRLLGVSAYSWDLCLAVGTYSFFTQQSGYVLRWEGDHWSVMHNRPGEPITDVSVIAPDDFWAVGTTSQPPPTPALAIHWDEASWQPFPTPLVADGDHRLDCVHASGSQNVWAAGSCHAVGGEAQAYVIRWDGASWQALPSPAAAAAVDVLTFAADDAWIALEGGDVWHWDGAAWSHVPDVVATSLAGRAPDDVHAFAGADIHHWNGASWTLAQSIAGVTAPSFRKGAQALPDGSIWAAGRAMNEDHEAVTLAIRRPPAGTDIEPIPAATMTLAAFPNPFNPRTTIEVSLPAPAHVRMTVHDIAGRRVRTLLDEARAAGPCAVSWDGADEQGRPLPSGTYVVRAVARGATRAVALALVR